jgi:hypothetical protein
MGVAAFSRPAHAQLAVAGDAGAPTVVVAWDDGTTRVPRVLVRVSRDGGATFARPAAASGGDAAATFPVLAAAPGRVALAWTAERATSDAHAGHGAGRPDRAARHTLPRVGARTVLVREATLD